MGSVLGCSQNHVEGNGEGRAHYQEFKHEVIERVFEDCAKRFADEWGPPVVAEVFRSLREVRSCETGV